jgi:hypothetical protein
MQEQEYDDRWVELLFDHECYALDDDCGICPICGLEVEDEDGQE